MVFRVYIANILLLLLLLTVSQVRCASAPVYSHQLIKFELLTQSIRQPSCQNIYMEDSVPLFSISVCLYYTIPLRVRQSDSARFFRIWRLTGYCSQVPPRSVFVRIMHENHETASAKMSVLCSFCVHHVAVSGEAVNSNAYRYCSPGAAARCFHAYFA